MEYGKALGKKYYKNRQNKTVERTMRKWKLEEINLKLRNKVQVGGKRN